MCWLASSKAPPFFIDLRGSSHSHMSRLELQWGKVPKVPRAGSKCSPLAVVHDERRKSRRERAVQREELEWGAKREGNERGTTTENAYVSYGTLSMVTLGRQSRNDCILQTLRTTLLLTSIHLILILMELLLIDTWQHRAEPGWTEHWSICICLKLSPSMWRCKTEVIQSCQHFHPGCRLQGVNGPSGGLNSI